MDENCNIEPPKHSAKQIPKKLDNSDTPAIIIDMVTEKLIEEVTTALKNELAGEIDVELKEEAINNFGDELEGGAPKGGLLSNLDCEGLEMAAGGFAEAQINQDEDIGAEVKREVQRALKTLRRGLKRDLKAQMALQLSVFSRGRS